MKLLFRVNYSSHPGQSLWLKLSTTAKNGRPLEQTHPLTWLNSGQWEGFLDLPVTSPARLTYHYQLRQEGNGVELDEWHAPREIDLDPARHATLVLLDTWCSAGTDDYAFESRGMTAALPPRGPFNSVSSAEDANLWFRLRMAAVPVGMVPCVSGSHEMLGQWDPARAVPLTEVAPNVWETALTISPDHAADYKYGLWSPAEARATRLEQGHNRHLPSRACGPRQFTRVCDEAYRRADHERPRGAGVAVPVFSLRTAESLGVGEFADLMPLADWAAAAGLKLIQILPINDTTSSHDWTDSYPYSAISVFALHPLYLRIDALPYPMLASFKADLAATRARLNPGATVDYTEVMREKLRLSRAIYEQHRANILAGIEFRAFTDANRKWLAPYCAFCVLRDRYGTADFTQWGEWSRYDDEMIRALTLETSPLWPELAYHAWLQFELDRQLADAVAHLHQLGIVLKGDLPIGIDRQSVDAWSQPGLFKMDAQAGAPPDAFAVKGQNWGFPTYDWDAMKQDGYAWWRARFAHLSRYFDAFRIDHILGFFRIWQVPHDQVEGIMGWFDPALTIHVDELHHRGIRFDLHRFCRPYIREHSLWDRFGDMEQRAKTEFLEPCGHGYWKLRDEVATQRLIADRLAAETAADGPDRERATVLRNALFDCASDLLLLEEPGSGGTRFHPRCLMQHTRSYQELDHDTRWRLDDLYNDYFYRRQEQFWQARGLEKLPAMRRASAMLLCGEDLGMVPDCVPGVMRELGILSLEIQRMPKDPKTDFFHPAHAPYASVVSPSTHDMSTLRGWWREDANTTARYAWHMLGMAHPPHDMTGEIAERILAQHFHSPAMWVIAPLQDLLAMDETLRHPDPDAERINIPAIMPYYWNYRMHLDLRELTAATDFNDRLTALVHGSGRGR